MMDCAISSRLCPVARNLAPIFLASSFISLRRNTPQYVQGLFSPVTEETESMVRPISEKDRILSGRPLDEQ